MKKQIVSILLAFVMAIGLAIPTLAATTADVTVNATGAFVSFSSNGSSYSFGIVATSSTTNTTANWALLTNTSSVSTNISVKMLAGTWTSSGSGWTHSDTAAGANTAAMKFATGNTTTWQTSSFVTTGGLNTVVTNLAANYNYVTGFSLLAPTSFTDGSSNNNTIRLTIIQS